jgi:hypothetical protein
MTAHKALVGAVLAALAAAAGWLTNALDDGSIAGKEWAGLLVVVVGALTAGLGVYETRNRLKAPDPVA